MLLVLPNSITERSRTVAQSHKSRKEEISMSKMTTEQMQELRAKQRVYRKEERLNSKTEYGISDPTPKQAVDNIISERRGN
jgi:translation initiation factor 2B subunit (eIF-2B alpha/beta/delta family)